MRSKFKEGDIVWGKVKGYPWWPGIVNFTSFRYQISLLRVEYLISQIYGIESEKSKEKIQINFIGDFSQ